MRVSGQWPVVGVVLVTGLVAVGWSAAAPMESAVLTRSGSVTARPPASASESIRDRLSAGPYPADSLARAAAARDLFRADRRPAEVTYDPVRGTAPPPNTPPKPTLVLSGIVWGSAPQAVIEGLPGIDGPRVMRIGDVVAGLKVRKIEVNRVVIAGLDTTWTLTVREPWK